MKKIIILTIIFINMNYVNAENLFQTNNPFPQTSPQTMNNIYESEPSVVQKETKNPKKTWFRKKDKIQQEQDNYVIPQSTIINEGSKDGSFYVFR